MALNVTTAAIASGANTAIAQPSLAQWDQGQILKIEGVELPESYQVEFSGGGTVRTVPMIGTAEGVQIPNKLLQSSHPITAHVVLHESTTDRETEYWITIYVKPRQAPETVEIDPADISIIDQTIAAAQQAVATSTAQAEAAAGSAEDAAAAAETAEASATAADGSASSAASSERSAGASAVEADQAKTAAETAQAAAEAAQAAAEQTVTDAQAAGSQAVEAIDEAKTVGIQAIDAEAATQINQVGRAGATQIRQINELASNQMRSIETKTTQSIGAIEDARDAAIEDVQTEGQTQTAAAQAQAQAAAGSATAAANSANAAAGSASAAATARTGAETAAASVSASAAQIAQNASDITDLNRQISESITPAIEEIETDLDGKAHVIVNTASGEIASFADGADGMPVKSLVANIEPVQDLHGYDHPWPAGGGKNLLQTTGTNLTKSGVTYTVKDDGSVLVNGTSTSVDPYTVGTVDLIGGTIYVLSSSATNDNDFFLQAVGSGISSTNTANGAFTFAPPSDMTATIRIVVNPNKTVSRVTIKPMICLSTATDPTVFAPYSNICPISGHTGASVTRTGENLFDKDAVSVNKWLSTTTGFEETSNGYFVSDYIPVEANKAIYMPDSGSIRRWFYDSTKNPKTYLGSPFLNEFTPTENGFIRVTLSNQVDLSSYQIEYGSTATAFEEYKGNQISITFPSSAGTVYGGTLDVTDGVLTVDRAMVTVDGSQVPIANLSNTGVFSTYETVLAGLPADKIEMYVSSRFKAHINSGISYMDNEFTVDGNKRIMIKAPNLFSTVNEANAYFVENPTQFVGLIQNPITYQLTPQELDTLLGTNNIWTDVGAVNVEYPADTKLYIEQLTKPTEDDMTADHAISAGTFFMIGNTLYLATSQIAAGGTITPGTNATQLSLADALNQLNT